MFLIFICSAARAHAHTRMPKFRSFYFRIYGKSIRNIRKFAPFENIPLYSNHLQHICIAVYGVWYPPSLLVIYTLGYIIYVNNCAFPPPDNVRFHSSFEFHSSFGFHGFHWFHSLWTGFLHSSFEFRSSFEFHWSGFYTSSEFLYLSFGFYSSLDFHTLCKCRPIMRYIKHLCVG